MTRAVAIVLLLAATACERERRDFKLPNGDQLTQATRLSQLQPGSPSQPINVDSPLRDNAYALSEGKRLYSAYNCVGCHAQGGGGIGPALMDHRWIYGSRGDQMAMWTFLSICKRPAELRDLPNSSMPDSRAVTCCGSGSPEPTSPSAGFLSCQAATRTTSRQSSTTAGSAVPAPPPTMGSG